MNDWSRSCWLCGRNGASDPLDEHHIFEGWGNRRVSVEYDITVPLCHDRCHIFGRDAAHNSKATADAPFFTKTAHTFQTEFHKSGFPVFSIHKKACPGL